MVIVWVLQAYMVIWVIARGAHVCSALQAHFIIDQIEGAFLDEMLNFIQNEMLDSISEMLDPIQKMLVSIGEMLDPIQEMLVAR